jgi:hypothetical protein
MQVMIFISVLSFACIVLYLTHQNQTWLKTPLEKKWRILGWFLMFFSFVIALLAWPIETGIYIFLIFIMLMFSLLPFVPLLKAEVKSNDHE